MKTKIILTLNCLIIVVSVIVEANFPQNSYDFPIAGGFSISECINGRRPKNSNSDEMYITTTEFARKSGYQTEEHVVLTEDGYILTLHRILGKRGAQPIFLQHGILNTSFKFVAIGKNKALAFILADKGYDVWLGNGRGSTYSRCHTHYTEFEYRFWNFSWHEMGAIDLPAEITYVTRITKQDIIFVSHSMGTTMSFVLAIERPDIASKVKVMLALSPIVYLNDVKSPLKYLTPFVRVVEIIARITGGRMMAPPKKLIKYFCSFTLIQQKFCATLLFTLVGFDYQQLNFTLFPRILYHLSDISLKVFCHYFQVRNARAFKYYDYGRDGNLKMYNNIEAPDYNISKINVPVGIFWSTNDYLTSEKEVLRLYEQLPNAILNYKVESPVFNHIDFVWSMDAPKYLYSKLLSVIKQYE